MLKVKISNLPRWISEIHLKQFFNSCGKIAEANIALDRDTLRPLGFGYITFIDTAGYNNALDKNGVLLDGTVIQVAEYTESENLDRPKEAEELQDL